MIALAFVLAVQPAPRPGVPSAFTVTDDAGAPVVGATLSVVQRPGLPSQKEVGIGITDSQGKVLWKPDLSGPALLLVGDQPAGAFHVASDAPPVSTVVPLLVLLVVGVGAVATGRRRRSV